MGPDSVNGMAFGSKGEKVLATQEAVDFALHLSFSEASEGISKVKSTDKNLIFLSKLSVFNAFVIFLFI